MLRVITLSMLVFFLSCSDDSGTGPGNNGVSLGTFRVDIDGSKWQATQNFVFSSISEGESYTLLTVSAGKTVSTTQSEAMAFSVSAPGNSISALEGTYALDGTGGAALSFVTTISDEVVSYLSYGGQITITEISASNVKGIFNATCANTVDQEDTITMTDGAFNVALVSP